MLKWMKKRKAKPTQQEKSSNGPRLWCPGCGGEISKTQPPVHDRSGNATDHFMCHCGCVSHWYIGAPVGILLGYTHWRNEHRPASPNWGKSIPRRTQDGVLYYYAPTDTFFIHTTKNEIVVYLAADLPQRWRSKVAWDLYPGYIACWGKGEKHHLFNGHTFTKEYCRDEEAHPQISKTDTPSQ